MLPTRDGEEAYYVSLNWWDTVTHEDVRVRTGQQSQRKTTALGWTTSAHYNKHTGIQNRARSGKNKLDRHSHKELQRLGLAWEEAETAVLGEQEWHRGVTQCVHVDAGWITVKVKD